MECTKFGKWVRVQNKINEINVICARSLVAADGWLDAEGDEVESEVADVFAGEPDCVGAAFAVEVGRGEVGAVDGHRGGRDVGPRTERRPAGSRNNLSLYYALVSLIFINLLISRKLEIV